MKIYKIRYYTLEEGLKVYLTAEKPSWSNYISQMKLTEKTWEEFEVSDVEYVFLKRLGMIE